MQSILLLFLLAGATASISVTLTKTAMFDFVRDALDPGGKIHYLWTCPYCMSHWIAAMWIVIYKPRIFTGAWVDLFPAWFVIVTMATFLIQGILIFGSLVSILKSIQEIKALEALPPESE